jgi:hypothetical protein
MKKVNPAPKEWRLFQNPTEKIMNQSLKTVWMADLKKAGERAECLWLKNRGVRAER